MKKLRVTVMALLLLLMVTITGCSNDISLTEEQNSVISEYIAGVLLHYSYENEWNYEKIKIAESKQKSESGSLISSSQLTTTQATQAAETSTSVSTAATVTSSGTSGTGLTQSSTQAATIAQNNGDPTQSMVSALGLNGVTISYSDYQIGDTYPTGDYIICVPAQTGCKVVAVEFTIRNTTGSDIEVNTTTSDMSMIMTVNGTTVPQSNTILKSDINNLTNVTIAAGQTYTAAAIFQVSDGLVEQISSMSVAVIENQTSLGTITLK